MDQTQLIKQSRPWGGSSKEIMKKETKNKDNIIAKLKKLILPYYKQIFFILLTVIILSIPFMLCLLANEYEFFERMLKSDVLSYYGVALGIFSSFVLYQIQQKKEEQQRKYDIRPKVVLSIEILDSEKEAYILTITNVGKRELSEIHFCGDFLCATLISKHYTSLNLECKQNEGQYNFENNQKRFFISGDNGNVPKYLSVQCTDEDGNNWAIDYKRFGVGKNASYQQEDIYLI